MRDYKLLAEGLRYCSKHICNKECGYYEICHRDRGKEYPSVTSVGFDAADAIEELLAAVPTWISVEERLPEDFQKVLVFWWEHGEPMIDTAFWQKDAKRFDGEHWVRMEDKVTHWMPLPEPPKGVE